MELARAIMCPANCIAPQSIIAGGERRDVFLHPGTVAPGHCLIARCCACAANGDVAAKALGKAMNSRRRI
jgi:hypothetical protein